MGTGSFSPSARSNACETEAVEDLLAAAGVSLPAPGTGDRSHLHPDLEWARSGAMALTGRAEGPPLLAPAPLASRARQVVDRLAALADTPELGSLDGAALLGERAGVFELERRGAISPSGSCRLLRTADGWLALNLARPEDVALLPAWLGGELLPDPWAFVADRVADRPTDELVERARLMGLPAAAAVEPPDPVPPWARVVLRGATRAASGAPLVMDLSALWAGPLCGHLLHLAGARVVKVESTGRPDGARAGPSAFFHLLNAEKPSVALDLAAPEGRRRLRCLVERADVVIESARPRALLQLGIDAEALVRERPGLTWVSITGYGRASPGANWVAFGDDAAVAAGLAAATAGPGAEPLFCGDAIADPLAGMHAALAALASFRCGGGRLLDVALRDVVAHLLAGSDSVREATLNRVEEGWRVERAGARQMVLAPRARPVRARARPLGADTEQVLSGLGLPC
jgi:crotonobetainyl-CoA:carnitine CoA-transferase CaiB-like acyl-CoA transferase